MKHIESASIGTSRQRGSALLVAVLLLALMLVLGVSAMESAINEEKLSANTRDRAIAFENSEAAMRSGMDYLRAEVLNGVGAPDNSAGYYYGGVIPIGGVITNNVDTMSLGFWQGYTLDPTNSMGLTMPTLQMSSATGRFLMERMRFDDETEPSSPTIYNVYFNVLTARAGGVNGGLTAQQATLVTIPR